MNGELCDPCVEAQFAPTLQRGDVIIPDNFFSHKSPKVARSCARSVPGSCFCRPDLNPIGMAFTKLKPLIRRAASPGPSRGLGSATAFATVKPSLISPHRFSAPSLWLVARRWPAGHTSPRCG